MTEDARRLAEGALCTDFYELTMAQVYWREGLAELPAQFDHFFRSNPDYGGHRAGYCINAGMEWLLDWMETAQFGSSEIAYLKQLRSANGNRVFDAGFVSWLAKHPRFDSLTIRGVPEGRVVHPSTPVTQVEGPLAHAQMLETYLLMQLNFQTLIATKASRVARAACGQPVLEFGARRAHERAANAGARAALIGGAIFTSNTGLSAAVGTDPKGTQAHSMVQAFMAQGGGELDAFRAYARSYPDDCLLLVDTVNTLDSGVPNAIRVFEELRRSGHEPVGVRLDSGDLAHLAVRTAMMLDSAGFRDTRIVLSNQLDEFVLGKILKQIREEAGQNGINPDALVGRLTFGVGTSLITSAGASSLDGVYKLSALRTNGSWVPLLKLSDSPRKLQVPGRKRLWRAYDKEGKAIFDLIALEDERPFEGESMLLHEVEQAHEYEVDRGREVGRAEELVRELLVEGVRSSREPLSELRNRVRGDLECLAPEVLDLLDPGRYRVLLSDRLFHLRDDLARSMRSRQRVREVAGP